MPGTGRQGVIMNRILLVEDNAAIIKGLSWTLKSEHFEVESADTFAKAETMICHTQYDLAVIDITLPDGNGYEVCRLIREVSPDTAVIFLTAKGEENDVVKGFDTGADDYIVKPFRNRELISRVKSVLRRYNKGETELKAGSVRVDLLANRVYRDGEEVFLTALEYRIAVLMIRNKGMTIPRERILDTIWDYAGNVVNDNTLTVYIKRIRAKLGEDFVHTVKGIGYRVDAS